jgi:hypothetical protein
MFPRRLVLIANTLGLGRYFVAGSKLFWSQPDGPNLEVSRYIHLNLLPGIPGILAATGSQRSSRTQPETRVGFAGRRKNIRCKSCIAAWGYGSKDPLVERRMRD